MVIAFLAYRRRKFKEVGKTWKISGLDSGTEESLRYKGQISAYDNCCTGICPNGTTGV